MFLLPCLRDTRQHAKVSTNDSCILLSLSLSSFYLSTTSTATTATTSTAMSKTQTWELKKRGRNINRSVWKQVAHIFFSLSISHTLAHFFVATTTRIFCLNVFCLSLSLLQHCGLIPNDFVKEVGNSYEIITCDRHNPKFESRPNICDDLRWVKQVQNMTRLYHFFLILVLFKQHFTEQTGFELRPSE